ncbi:MAG: asparaginase [Candidatus Aminicenantes bacterium]|nr:asparaginase [Candidatus Aminicenantes bacterium]
MKGDNEVAQKIDRRTFIKSGVGLSAASLISKGSQPFYQNAENSRPVVIASANGLRATEKAMKMMRQGKDSLDSVIAGVNIIESDPEDITVGYGGLPNEEGVVELDSSVMHGPSHNAGAVASLRHIKNPSKVARLVMERTAHALLVGEGALKFALSHGFKKENLLTEKSRKIWLKKKESLSDKDFWYPPPVEIKKSDPHALLESHGTINCCALDVQGQLAGVTTTSGFFYKIPGRVGDSPLIGAGLYVDNNVGAAGSTGFGEANILTCGSYSVVEFMRQGHGPEQACLKSLKRVANKARLWPGYKDEKGRPIFDLNFYAVNKRGEFAGASLWKGKHFAAHDGQKNRLRECAYLYEK